MNGPCPAPSSDPSEENYADMAQWAANRATPSYKTLVPIYESPSRLLLPQDLQDRLASQIGVVMGNLAVELLEKLDSLDRCDPLHIESVGRLMLIHASPYYQHINEKIRLKIDERMLIESILSDLYVLTIDKDASERTLVEAECRMMLIRGAPRFLSLPEGIKQKIDSYLEGFQKK